VLDDHDGGVLIFDEFEEVLTADPTDIRDKEEFFDRLATVLRPTRGQPGRWWAVFAMREDYKA